MAERPQRASRLLLGPRALAVISCALALLAAQPALGAVENVGERVSSVRASHAVGPVTSAEPMAVAVTKRTRGATLQQQAKARAVQRLHVLATVEILQRLLTLELQPMERHVISAFILDPVCVLILDTPGSPPHRPPVAQGAGGSAERDYAMARLGLAPPLA